jgi:hypothetical protein
MLSIGKSWMKIVRKYGLWNSSDKLSICHTKLSKCLKNPAYFEHSHVGGSNEPGTNLPQVAANVCHLLTDGCFELVNDKLTDGIYRTGCFVKNPEPGETLDKYVPRFQLSGKVKSLAEKVDVHLEINDIVELIFEGTYLGGAREIPKLTTADTWWSIWAQKFTKE